MDTPRLDAGNYVISMAEYRRWPISLPVSDTILASLVLGKHEPFDFGPGRKSSIYAIRFDLFQGALMAEGRATIRDAPGSIHFDYEFVDGFN